MEKLLSIAVPSYNSEAYLAKCLDSMICGGAELDVIIVNDGSTDGTAELAQTYVDRYPEIFRLVNKENGGHGSGVNKGIELARGRFFRVVDSDDWVGEEALLKLLDYIRGMSSPEDTPDMLITNYIYEYTYNDSRRTVDYRKIFKKEKSLHSWKDLGFIKIDQVFAMHSLNYRTEVLRQSGLKLPEHCFYVDNLYDYIPLPWVDSIAWLNVELYHYFIGRDDQSVHTPVMIKRINQQLRVTYLMIEAYHLEEEIKDKYKRRYMYRWLSLIIMISQIHLTLADTTESLQKITDMWQHLKDHDAQMYRKVRSSFVNIMTNLPGKLGRYIDRKGFFIAQKIFKFS